MASGSASRGRGAGVGVGVLSSLGRGGRPGGWASSSKTFGGF